MIPPSTAGTGWQGEDKTYMTAPGSDQYRPESASLPRSKHMYADQIERENDTHVPIERLLTDMLLVALPLNNIKTGPHA